jgi:hypothetical protein
MVGRRLLVSFPNYEELLFEGRPWQDDDEVTTTFGTLKQSVREAAEAERNRIVALLERVCTCKFENNCSYCDAIAIVRLGHL